MSDWTGTTIAGVALVVSMWTAAAAYLLSRRESRTANLTAYFHWNREKSGVTTSVANLFNCVHVLRLFPICAI
jgi:hypothetical protein